MKYSADAIVLAWRNINCDTGLLDRKKFSLEEQRTDSKGDSNITSHILRNILWLNYSSNWNRLFK